MVINIMNANFYSGITCSKCGKKAYLMPFEVFFFQ